MSTNWLGINIDVSSPVNLDWLWGLCFNGYVTIKFLKGQIYKKKGEHRKARSYTVKAYELRPDLEEISKQLISLDIELGYYDEALFLLSQIP